MMRGDRTYTLPLWAASGALFFVSWLSPLLWWLVLPAIVLFLMAAKTTTRLGSTVWGSWLAGALKAGGATLWFFSMYPLAWSGISSPFIQMLLIGVYWLGISGAIGFGMTLPALSMLLVRRYNLIVFPFLFVLGEVLGSWCFSLYSLGDGAIPNIHFGFGYIGFLIAGTAFSVPLAAISGVYGLSAGVALLGTALYVFLAHPQVRRRIIAGGLISLIVLGVAAAMIRNSRAGVQIGRDVIAIETSFPSESAESGSVLATEKAAAVNAAVTAALTRNPDFVLLPEDSRLTTTYGTPAGTLAALIERNHTATVVDTSRWTDERGRTVLRAFYYDLAAGRVYTADKQYLVPQGEFVPYLVLAVAQVFGGSATLSRIAHDQDYVRGANDERETLPGAYPGLLFCSESVSPYLARILGSSRTVPFMLHPVSHARFHNSTLLARELDAMLRVSAIWSNHTIISAGNMAPSNAYTPDGTIVRGEVQDEHPQWRLVEYVR